MSENNAKDFVSPVDEVTQEAVLEPAASEVNSEPRSPDSREEKKTKIGVVTDCVKLNVRKKPHLNADVVREIPLATEVTIDERRSTDDFYSVRLSDGAYGFCMKKYIAV